MSIASASPFVTSLEHITGFLVVLFALTLLWAITTILGKVFSRMEGLTQAEEENIGLEAEEEPEGVAAPAPLPVAAVAGGPSDEEVVAITAVVSALMGRRSRIVSIRSGGAKDWNREGRREHFASHRIR
ncbi:MAG: OadG family protein [Puniceicoccaceae bacterium]